MAARSAQRRGGAVQVYPIKHTLIVPGTKRLKLKHDGTAFNFCYQFQLAPLQRDRRPPHRRGDGDRLQGAKRPNLHHLTSRI